MLPGQPSAMAGGESSAVSGMPPGVQHKQAWSSSKHSCTMHGPCCLFGHPAPAVPTGECWQQSRALTCPHRLVQVQGQGDGVPAWAAGPCLLGIPGTREAERGGWHSPSTSRCALPVLQGSSTGSRCWKSHGKGGRDVSQLRPGWEWREMEVEAEFLRAMETVIKSSSPGVH